MKGESFVRGFGYTTVGKFYSVPMKGGKGKGEMGWIIRGETCNAHTHTTFLSPLSLLHFNDTITHSVNLGFDGDSSGLGGLVARDVQIYHSM